MFSAGQEGPASALRHETLLAVGVRVRVDLTTPHRWRSVTVSSWNFSADRIIRDLVGTSAVGYINEGLRPCTAHSPSIEVDQIEVDPSAAGPWLRVAVVDALDRWLQLPLDQSLVDAERGVARTRAALNLPEGRARTALLHEALLLARRAAPGLVTYLTRLGHRHVPLPPALLDGLRRLIEGYRALLAEVRGHDENLTAVVDAYGSFRVVALPRHRSHPGARLPTHGDVSPRASAAGLIDPRQVPARTLQLDTDPDRPEITVRPLSSSSFRNARTVIVDVPVFRRIAVDHGVGSRMLARLVDRDTGRARGEALLTLHPGDAQDTRRSTLRGVLRIPPDQEAIDLETVRVDVFDALNERQPATTDNESALHNARRAILALGEWRQLVAEARIQPAVAHPVGRVRRIGRLLFPGGETAGRVCAPASVGLGRQHLEKLSGLSDSELLERLQTTEWLNADDNDADSILAPALGPSDLLVAELAAVFEQAHS
ncbi:hypothetical protein [Kineosporia mesophila]|nr:hypothetical protein [Kineosporia mesophila]MCD5351814.1 hypothetical protein [Kineosporia mesophila]